MDYTTFCISLPNDQLEFIKQQAAMRGVTFSDVVLAAVNDMQAAQQPKVDPISMAIANFHASTQLSKDDGQWQKLFWKVAHILKCLPSSFVDENQHVLRAAAKAMEAQQPAQAAADARDAERYRWLKSQPVEVPANGPDLTVWDENGSGDALRGDAADAAIDAALATHQQRQDGGEGK